MNDRQGRVFEETKMRTGTISLSGIEVFLKGNTGWKERWMKIMRVFEKVTGIHDEFATNEKRRKMAAINWFRKRAAMPKSFQKWQKSRKFTFKGVFFFKCTKILRSLSFYFHFFYIFTICKFILITQRHRTKKPGI